MNKIMFDILLSVHNQKKYNEKSLARALYKPYSVVEQEYKRLVHEGYIEDGKLTSKGYGVINDHKIDNAIILAAGISSRFVPICFEKPKALMKVKGEILIERQIKQLKEAGINEISIVVGYMNNAFDYLKGCYGVDLIYTDTFRTRNNHASVLAAKDRLKNTIVTSADLYFTENIFQAYAYDAYYCAIYQEGETAERGVTTDLYDRMLQTSYGVADTWVTLGYAFFNERFSKKFIEILENEYNWPETQGKFWADIQDSHLQELYMYVKRCDNDIIYEFDSLDELRSFDMDYLDDTQSAIIKEIAAHLNAAERELSGFLPLTKEDVGRGFTFLLNNKRYVCRLTDNFDIGEICRFDDKIQELVSLTESFVTYYDKSLPLCAAENVISPFAKMPLSMGFQERYIVGNTYSYSESDNFIGSTYLLPFYEMISEQCKRMFGAKYSDARTLTGMNCLMMVLTALSKNGDHVLILGSSAGGHASVRPIAERLGAIVEDVPFDFANMDIDYDALNAKLSEDDIAFVLLAPSDIIKPFSVEKIDTSKTVLLYDVSQMMGLIGAGVINNPLEKIDNMVMFGGTHKTFPGPASGLIMTNNDELHSRLETTINPIYIRHTQMHQKVCLLFALVEAEVFGRAYQEHIVSLSNALAAALLKRGFSVGVANKEKYTCTQQVFLYTGKEMMDKIFVNATRFGITLNKKHKDLFKGYGIRLGTQEIARYGWPEEAMDTVAEIIHEISKTEVNGEYVEQLLNKLPPKNIQYTFDESTLAYFNRFLYV